MLSAAVLVLVLEYDTIATTQLSSVPELGIPLRSPNVHLPQNAFQSRENSCGASHLAVVEYEYEYEDEYEYEYDPENHPSIQNARRGRKVTFRCGVTEPESLL